MTHHPAGVRHLDGPAGRLEARIDEPAGPPRAVAVLAPPHPELGGTLHDRVVYHATQGLIRVGCAVVRFTFRGALNEDLVLGGDGDTSSDPLSDENDNHLPMHNWNAGARLGYEF